MKKSFFFKMFLVKMQQNQEMQGHKFSLEGRGKSLRQKPASVLGTLQIIRDTFWHFLTHTQM